MNDSPKVIPFTPGRDIAREVSLRVARLANEDRCANGRRGFSEIELAEVILVAIGTYREAIGR